MTAALDDDLTFTDVFCGAGGSIDGMVNAGFKFVVGANHWARAIETVAANYSDAELLCTDINHYDMRRLPKTRVLWASVICTELSPAGGNKKVRGQLSLEEHGHVPKAAYERTRACALDVVRATEVHRYDAVVVENVVEFARDWELYDWWVEGMCLLGYEVQVVNASAAHVHGEGNDPAPQWRDRIFIVFIRKGIPKPNLELRPPSWCFLCEETVEGVQTWKRPDRSRIGKYGQQYVYRCPNAKCQHSVVEPLVLPAAAAIDWSNLGERIGDRSKPLAASTMARIEAGLRMFAEPVVATVAGNTFERPGYWRVWPANGSPLTTRQATGCDAVASLPVMVNSNHDDTRVYPAHAAPLPTRTVKIGDGVAVPQPFVTMLRANNRATGVDEPLATLATARHHYLTVPDGSFYVKNFGGNARPEHMAKDVQLDPLGSITTKDHHALVVPYRRGRTRTTAEPLHTLSTKDSAALCTVELDVMNARYRMLTPREHLRGQRFRDEYVVAGNLGEQTMQAGNAVACNVAQWIGTRIREALEAA